MMQGSTAEDILQESRQVLKTNGEWELADIKIANVSLSLDVGDYSEIQYSVSTFAVIILWSLIWTIMVDYTA